MIEVKGKYNNAIIYSDRYDDSAYKQILDLCNLKSFSGAQIRIMPDYHAGKGCTVGFTALGVDYLIPNIIGVDIGCGVHAIKIDRKAAFSVQDLDDFINDYIPAGFEVNETSDIYFPFDTLRCYDHLHDKDRLSNSLGSLGGGNHFIEVDVDKEGNYWLIVHSGSRNLGKQVAEHYQKIAEKIQGGLKDVIALKIKNVLPKEREAWLKQVKEEHKLPKGLEHLNGKFLEDYIHDMKIATIFAEKNRMEILSRIIRRFNLFKHMMDNIISVHNYYENGIIRKGAINADKGKQVIIPLNMRDGCLIGVGKGNPGWNYSAPHGAGRLYSRAEAKRELSMEDFREAMKDVYTTSVVESTLDESPAAYKPAQEIIEAVKDTIDIVDIIKPVYNFKAK